MDSGLDQLSTPGYWDQWAGILVGKELVAKGRAGIVLADGGGRSLPPAHRELLGRVHRLRFLSGLRRVESASGLKAALA